MPTTSAMHDLDDPVAELREVLHERHAAVVELHGGTARGAHQVLVRRRRRAPVTPSAWRFFDRRAVLGGRLLGGASARGRCGLRAGFLAAARGLRGRRRVRRRLGRRRAAAAARGRDRRRAARCAPDGRRRTARPAASSLAGRCAGRRRGRVVGVVEGAADLVLEAGRQPPEVGHRLADLAGRVGEALRAQHDQGQQHDDDQLATPDVEHRPSVRRRPGGQMRRDGRPQGPGGGRLSGR